MNSAISCDGRIWKNFLSNATIELISIGQIGGRGMGFLSYSADSIFYYFKDKAYKKCDDMLLNKEIKKIKTDLNNYIEKIKESDSSEHDYIKGFTESKLKELTQKDGLVKINEDDLVKQYENKYNCKLTVSEKEELITCFRMLNVRVTKLLSRDNSILYQLLKGESDKIILKLDETNKELSETKELATDIKSDVGKILRNQEESQTKKQTDHSDTKIFHSNNYQKYIDKWEKTTLFLHKDRPENEQLKLKDIYVVPTYTRANNIAPRDDLEALIDRYYDINEEWEPLIVLGQPGVGKSSLVSYICSKRPENCDLVVLRFQDLNKEVISKYEDGLLRAVLRRLDCEIEDLENVNLILDGFDEITINVDKDGLVSKFMLDVKNTENLKVIITSRLNYISERRTSYFKVIRLNFFDESKIREFINKFYAKDKQEICHIGFTTNVMGIPLVLYMALSLKIEVAKNMGLPELYSKIFDLDGGIYARLYDDKVHHLAEPKLKEEVYLISQKIAFAMFEKDRLELTKDEYVNIVNKESSERVEDFAIANYYDIGEKLCFVHKSIYEYFVAEYMYQRIKETLISNSDEVLAKCFGKMLGRNVFTNEILNYFKFKIHKDIIVDDKFRSFSKAFNYMLKYGMTYCIERQSLIGIIYYEIRCFENMLHIIHLEYYKDNKLITVDDDVDKYFNDYLRFFYVVNEGDIVLMDLNKKKFRLNLSKMNLIAMNLARIKIINANLIGADLRKADLTGSILIGSILTRVDLRGVDLKGVDLRGVDLKEADLRKADLRGANLRGADLKGADLKGADLQEANLLFVNLREVKLDEDNIKYVLKNRVENLESTEIWCNDLNKYLLFPEFMKYNKNEPRYNVRQSPYCNHKNYSTTL